MNSNSIKLPPIKQSARWCWSSIALFALSIVTGPIATLLQGSQGGDDTMAAAINAAIASGIILCVGFVVSVIGFAKERHRPILRWVSILLYIALMPLILGVAFLVG